MYIYWIQTSNLTGLLFAPFLFRGFINILNVKGFFFLKKKKKAVLKGYCYLYTPIKKEMSGNAFNWNANRKKKKPP